MTYPHQDGTFDPVTPSDPLGDAHPLFSALLDEMARPAHLGWDVFGRILTRVLVNGQPAPQVDIAQGKMLAKPRPISATTVSRGTKELVAVGLLTPTIGTSRGRSALSLRAGGPNWTTVGVHLGHKDGAVNEIVVVLVEIGAERPIAMKSDSDLSIGVSDPSHVVARTARLVNELLEQASDEGRYVLGVGVEIGGQVHQGSIIAYSNGSFSSDGFAERLSKLLPARIPGDSRIPGRDVLAGFVDALFLPVVLENDVNALAIQRAYSRDASRNFTVVAVFEEGIGGAIIRDGQIVRGSRGATGEVGHLFAEFRDDNWEGGKRFPIREAELTMPIAHRRFDDPCGCGEYGHVQCFATPSRISAQLDFDAYEQFVDAAHQSSRDAAGDLNEVGRVFRRAGRALGRGLVQFATCTDAGELLLLLPYELVKVAPHTAAWEYREAIEVEFDHGFSTTREAARRGMDSLTVESLARSSGSGEQGATAAALCVIDAFIEHARSRDGCMPNRDAPASLMIEAKTGAPIVTQAAVTDSLDRTSRGRPNLDSTVAS